MRPASSPPSAPDFPVLAGRALAWCRHPVAAWRIASRGARAGIIAGYFGAGYLLGIAVLAAFG